MTGTVKLAPSILAADFARLGDQVAEAERAGADRIHVDVMDGHFVPNISMGAPIISSLRKATRLPLEAHLMISDPDFFVEEFAQAGTDSFMVHWEGNNDLSRTVQRIKALGKTGRRRHQSGDASGGAGRNHSRPRPGAGHDGEPGIRASALPPHDAPQDRSCTPDDRSDQTGVRPRGRRRGRCRPPLRWRLPPAPTSWWRGRRYSMTAKVSPTP